MGRIELSGYGEGMTLDEARMNWLNELSEQNGNDSYRGGGQDLDKFTLTKMVKSPVQAKAPKKVAIKKSKTGYKGKWIAGYKVTNNNHIGSLASPHTFHVLVETLTDAKQNATKLATKYSSKYFILPVRLFKTDKGVLHEELPVFEAEPVGGAEAVPGRWYFEGLFRY